MALWLAAAIVAIVVLLTPGSSQAHEGHGPREAMHPSIAVDAAPVDAQAALRATLARAPGEIRAIALVCADPCCLGGHTSSCGCAIGLAPSPEAAALRPRHDARPLPASARSRPDIPLDALPEPPRPLA